MNSILKQTLLDENIKFSSLETENFKSINVKGNKAVKKVKAVLYVLNFNFIFTQPLGSEKFEILYN